MGGGGRGWLKGGWQCLLEDWSQLRSEKREACVKALWCAGDQWKVSWYSWSKGKCVNRTITDTGPDCTRPFELCLKILNFRARRCQNDFKLGDHHSSIGLFFFNLAVSGLNCSTCTQLQRMVSAGLAYKFVQLFFTYGKVRTNFLANSVVLWPGIKPEPPALAAWSPSQWATRQVPSFFFFFFLTSNDDFWFLVLLNKTKKICVTT